MLDIEGEKVVGGGGNIKIWDVLEPETFGRDAAIGLALKRRVQC